MSHWCPQHVQYEAKQPPEPNCWRCWKLYLIKCPEFLHDAIRMLNEEQGEQS